MIDPHYTASPHSAGSGQKERPVFRMVSHDRMGGSVPTWARPQGAQEKTLAHLSRAQNPASVDQGFAGEMALSYHHAAGAAGANNTDNGGDNTPFGFGDLIDIINPLHHIPLVGHLYRHVTGDQIRPSSAIIGGAVFGGVLGAAGGVANLIIKEESGRDFTEHALNLATPQSPSPNIAAQESATISPVIARLENAGKPPAPIGALAFLDMAYHPPAAATLAEPLAKALVKPQAPPPSRVAAMYRFND